ncbi:MAG: PrkA family serine protein kinase [Minisyncoccia bacterium]
MAHTSATAVFDRIRQRSAKPTMMTLTDYLEGCRSNSGYYATAAERLLEAIGKPIVINTGRSGDARLGRIHQNRTIRVFPAFAEFHGIEAPIEEVYNFFKAAAQGLEERKQIMYLLGPVGSAKSSVAERLKDLMEQRPIYVLAVPSRDRAGKVIPAEYDLSPLYESPLGLFPKEDAAEMEEAYGVPRRHFDGICSPWASKRLKEFEGDVSHFFVAELFPSRMREIGIAKTEPGDENNQDISSLVGKVDVRKLEKFEISDPDAYSYSGALCRASQGLMEFVEMFKAPIKTLHPLLTATQERNFLGTENIGAMPFRGIILAHSNEAEWDKFKGDKRNEAFLDRVKTIRFKYNLRLNEEQDIYRKLLVGSALAEMPIAPYSLELLARTVVASRLKPTSQKIKMEFKVRIYNGEDLRDELPDLVTLSHLTKEAGLDEGMTGLSTRTAFKIISRAANAGEEIGLDPVELERMMIEEITLLFGGPEAAKTTLTFIEEQSKGWLYPAVGDMIKEALLENYEQFAQSRFERYYDQASTFLNRDVGVYADPDTGQMIDKSELAKRLAEIETPAKIPDGKDFRYSFTRFVDRYRMDNGGVMPRWDIYEPMRKVIKALVEKQTTDLIPLVAFEEKRDSEMQRKHTEFVARMKAKGFTEVQVKRIVSWYQNMQRSS